MYFIFFFAASGTMNQSPLFPKSRMGKWPYVQPDNFATNNRNQKTLSTFDNLQIPIFQWNTLITITITIITTFSNLLNVGISILITSDCHAFLHQTICCYNKMDIGPITHYYLLNEACAKKDFHKINFLLNKKVILLNKIKHPYINGCFLNDCALCKKQGIVINKHYNEFIIRFNDTYRNISKSSPSLSSLS
jgi:hypothetical protein